MVRLVFRPYTQVRRSICTSESLRTSTRVSSGFILLRHSSPSFGSQRARSRSASTTTRTRRAGSAPRPRKEGVLPERSSRERLHFHCAFGFRTTLRLARMLDSLVRVSRRVGWGADRFAADPGHRDAGGPVLARLVVREHCEQSSLVRRAEEAGAGAARRAVPRSARPADALGAVTLGARRRRVTFPEGSRRPTDRSRRSPRGKCARRRASRPGAGREIRPPRRRRPAS